METRAYDASECGGKVCGKGGVGGVKVSFKLADACARDAFCDDQRKQQAYRNQDMGKMIFRIAVTI